jgi:hypothetical protein
MVAVAQRVAVTPALAGQKSADLLPFVPVGNHVSGMAILAVRGCSGRFGEKARK